MEDHIAEELHKWRVFLKQAESCPVPINSSTLKAIKLKGFSAWDMSINLWTCISKWLGKKQYEKRNRMVATWDNNGVELWRRLHVESEGLSPANITWPSDRTFLAKTSGHPPA